MGDCSKRVLYQEDWRNYKEINQQAKVVLSFALRFTFSIFYGNRARSTNMMEVERSLYFDLTCKGLDIVARKQHKLGPMSFSANLRSRSTWPLFPPVGMEKKLWR